MENKHAIYLNMCHHYRKIFNAKSRVDTSPPKFLQKKNNHQKYAGKPRQIHSISNNSSVTSLTTETISKRNDNPVICPYFYQHHIKDMEPGTVNKSFLVSKTPFSPILRSDAKSRLRSLHVYHPPRKRRTALNNSKSSKSSQVVAANDRIEKKLEDECFQTLDTKSYTRFGNSCSEESSEDSAYNEGECILSSDSRGSTPQIISFKNQLAKKSVGTISNCTKIARKFSLSQTTEDDIVCIQFLKEITSDILQKNIFTNKALRAVFQHHMALNKYELDKDKALKEVLKLQERLGLPKDDQFDDEDYGLGKDLSNCVEILEEKEELADEVVICTENPSTDPNEDNKNIINNEEERSQHEIEGYEENYSDSFSDISKGDYERSENNDSTDTDNEEVVSNSKESNENYDSDGGENYRTNINDNSNTDSDLEILEEC